LAPKAFSQQYSIVWKENHAYLKEVRISSTPHDYFSQTRNLGSTLTKKILVVLLFGYTCFLSQWNTREKKHLHILEKTGGFN